MKLPKVGPILVLKPQPPSGGCVLKRTDFVPQISNIKPAAFGRLCVEILKWRENVLAAVY